MHKIVKQLLIIKKKDLQNVLILFYENMEN